MQSELLRVMLDPLSYCDPSRRPLVLPSEARTRAVLNQHLIRKYRLPGMPTGQLSGLEREVLANWFHLRRAAYLMGAYRRRNALLQQRGFQQCDPVLRQFLLLQLPGMVSLGAHSQVDENSLLLHGADILEPWLRPLRPGWRARAALQFPDSVAWSSPSGEPLNRSFISLALHYAKTT